MSTGHSLFFPKPALKGQARLKNIQNYVKNYPELFADMRSAKRVTQRITMPADGSWAYGTNPKAATTTTYAALFEMTAGVKLTAHMDEGLADWADQSPQNMDVAQFIYQLAEFENSIEAMRNAFRFSGVRNQVERAASSFRFICYTQKNGMRQFFADRVRMNVMGFDWDKDPYTEQGFEKFLNYVEFEAQDTRATGRLPDPHFRPQAMNMCLDALDPHLVFRVDDLAEGLNVLATQLGRRPLEKQTTSARLNAQPQRQIYTAHAALTERVYAQDYEIYESASCALRKDWNTPEKVV